MAAYKAAQIDAILKSPGDPKQLLIKTLANATLVDSTGDYVPDTKLPPGDFTIAQAKAFAERYTPVAALDQDGAGAVIFKDNVSGQYVFSVRGTDVPSNIVQDLQADVAIAGNQVPAYQTTLIVNFLLRETAPANTVVPQFSVQGFISSADDLLAGVGNLLTRAAGGEVGSNADSLSIPKLNVTSTVAGTGNAVGVCVDATGHSEGSPEVTVAAAVVDCMRTTTVNGPGASLVQMQGMVEQFTQGAHLPSVNLSDRNQINIDTTGPSGISQLNGGLPGEPSLLPIPFSINPVTNHSAVTAMNAAEQRLHDMETNAGQDQNNVITGGTDHTTTASSGEDPSTGGADTTSATTQSPATGQPDSLQISQGSGGSSATAPETIVAIQNTIASKASIFTGGANSSAPIPITGEQGQITGYRVENENGDGLRLVSRFGLFTVFLR